MKICDWNTLGLQNYFFHKCLAIVLALSATHPSSVQAGNSYTASNATLEIDRDGMRDTCLLDKKIDYAVESYDKSAIIVSERGYIAKSDVANCGNGKLVHVNMIPDKVGFISDINLVKRIYVALDFVSTRPYRYLATIAHIGSSKSLVTIDGTYLSGVPLSQLREHAFSASGEAGASIISINGRYVAPNGVVSCRDEARPGVWDVLTNRKVVEDEDSCSELFKSGEE